MDCEPAKKDGNQGARVTSKKLGSWFHASVMGKKVAEPRSHHDIRNKVLVHEKGVEADSDKQVAEAMLEVGVGDGFDKEDCLEEMNSVVKTLTSQIIEIDKQPTGRWDERTRRRVEKTKLTLLGKRWKKFVRGKENVGQCVDSKKRMLHHISQM
ncbi:uncharacterized protein G2W53_001156 [Senna tora]|uniref:Uncharacterized protein n=1 Tax=Senna tora TaxID=362788 RepID=A0A834XI03_9FABA|nr:uncharacterized protein G2W53_001156 [Senna tora]